MLLMFPTYQDTKFIMGLKRVINMLILLKLVMLLPIPFQMPRLMIISIFQPMILILKEVQM